MRFANRHIVVTGAASGLGLAIARAVETEGAVVTALDRNPAPFADAHVCDVGDETAAAAALAHLPRIDALVNAAGVPLRQPVADTDMADYDRLMAVNLRGLFLVSKLALPRMKARGGAVLHFSSCVGVTGARNRAAYSASKGAIIALTRSMALDYAPDGIRVNLVSAGPLKTLAAKAIPGFEELESMWSGRSPLGWDNTDQTPTAKAVCALLSDFFPATTGEIVHVDGGFHAMGA